LGGFCGWEALTIERGKERVMVTSGMVRCRPMGRVAEGHIERANGMRKKRRK
jgi:hypothetical protein